MKKLNFDELRELLNQKEERYEGLKWVATVLLSSAKWELDTDQQTREKEDSDLTIDDFKECEFGSWTNRRGKYEALKEVLEYIDKAISKL